MAMSSSPQSNVGTLEKALASNLNRCAPQGQSGGVCRQTGDSPYVPGGWSNGDFSESYAASGVRYVLMMKNSVDSGSHSEARESLRGGLAGMIRGAKNLFPKQINRASKKVSTSQETEPRRPRTKMLKE